MHLKLAASIAAVLLLGIAGTLAAHGAFAPLNISEQTAGPYDFVYRTAPQGDFGAVRSITTELEAAFRTMGVHDMKPLDVFFPPDSHEPAQIGFIVAKTDLPRISQMANPPRYRVIPAGEFLTAALPYRSPFSFMVGYWKVDPKLREYRAANGLKQTWAATINEGPRILYLQPKERRD